MESKRKDNVTLGTKVTVGESTSKMAVDDLDPRPKVSSPPTGSTPRPAGSLFLGSGEKQAGRRRLENYWTKETAEEPKESVSRWVHPTVG